MDYFDLLISLLCILWWYCMLYTWLDVSQCVYQHRHKLSHAVQTLRSHVQQTVVCVVEERVAVGVAAQLFVGRDLVSEEERDGRMLSVTTQQVLDEAAELVDDERARAYVVQVHGRQLLILGPFCISGINVAITWAIERFV